MSAVVTSPVGRLLREWRRRRGFSQLALALAADTSTRHLSFVETGRSTPSREMLLRLAGCLEVPLRDRNELLLAAGYAPAHAERDLHGADLGAVLEAARRLLAAHEPFPAVAVDRHWDLVEANAGIALFTEDCADELLRPPVNVLRLALHPEGLAPRIVNLAQWRARVLGGLRDQYRATADPALRELAAELAGYPGGGPAGPLDPVDGVVTPLRYRRRGVELTFLSTTSVFGAPRDVTVDELAIESFHPADAATREALRARERKVGL